jgi:hypothetical protein
MGSQEVPRLTQQQLSLLPLQQTLKQDEDIPLSPKIMTPDPYLVNPPMHKKVPGRRNISETSLDFSVLKSPKKNPFDLGAFDGVDLPTDFKVGTICDNLSSISKHDLNEPLIGLVGEKRLKEVAETHGLGLFFNDDPERLEILSFEEGCPSATKRQRLD